MNAKRKLLVTGAHGFVAGSVLVQAGDEWELHALSRGGEAKARRDWRWHAVDPLDAAALERVFIAVRPDAVVHTAAIADIDFCQANQALARSVNVEMTRTLAELCGHGRARLVFCSTDTVFDGEHAPYREEDSPGPVNFYAETKVEAEQCVGGLGAQGIIARLALVVGLPLWGAGNSFLMRVVTALKAGKTVSTAAEEVRTPIDVITLGRALLELAGGGQSGVFHLAGLTRVNRLQMNQTIAARFGFPLHLLAAQPPAERSGRAPRPRDVSLQCAKAGAQLKTPLRTFDEGLSLILERGNTSAA
ncbi:MAG TPA: NAD(P)-dependent oxidoreductase [Verrucomicrobiae bacterium]